MKKITIKKNKIHHRPMSNKPRTCEGCKETIKKKRPYVFVYKYWGGVNYKIYYHNEECYNLENVNNKNKDNR